MERNNTHCWLLVSFESWHREVLTSVGVPKELADAMLTDSELLALYRLATEAQSSKPHPSGRVALDKMEKVLKQARLLK